MNRPFFTILLALCLLLPGWNLSGNEPYAKYHYFVTDKGDRIICDIKDDNAKTIRISPKVRARYVESSSFMVSYTRILKQEVSGNLVIPSQVNLRFHDEINNTDRAAGIYTVAVVDEDAFKNCSELVSVTLPVSVSHVNSHAFMNCGKLRTVNFPATIEYINMNFADGCPNLETVNVGSGNGISYQSYDGILCKDHVAVFCVPAKTEISLPESIRGMAKELFAGNDRIRSVSIYGCGEISDGAFKNCKSLSYVSLQGKVKKIGEEAFKGCSSLMEINLPASVEYIGYGAFSGCQMLESIVLPSGLAFVNTELFMDCAMLRSITIPSSVENIYSRAFKNCTGLEKVVFQNGLKYIYTEAFYFCGSLRKVVLPSTLVEIGTKAFMGCMSLEEVVLGSGIQLLDRYAFFGCSSLRSVNVPEGAKFYEETFYDCENLKL